VSIRPAPFEILAAAQRLRGIALHTPLEPSPVLADESGASEVRLKLELIQPTGAFKTRGAHNKVALIAGETPDAPLVTASSGNHGIAVATAALAGVFFGMRSAFDPNAGAAELLYAFEAVVIGGIGSLWGTLWGGIVLGVAQSVGAQINPEYFALGGHAVFLAVLVLRVAVQVPGVRARIALPGRAAA